MTEFIKVAKELKVKDISDSFVKQYQIPNDVKSSEIIWSDTENVKDVNKDVEINCEEERTENVQSSWKSNLYTHRKTPI